MTIDLTTITTAFGLLDAETQAQIRAAKKAGMRIGFYASNAVWLEMRHDIFIENITYRLAPGQVWPKPEPKREVRYVHMISDGRITLDRLPVSSTLLGSPVIGRARVEVVEGQFDD